MPPPAGNPTSTTDSYVRSCGPQVVIKAVPQPSRSKKAHADDVMAEVGAMQLLHQHHYHHHPSSSSHRPHLTGGHHVIDLLDVFQDSEYIYLVLPYLSGGDLFTKVEASKGKGLEVEMVKSYFWQVVTG